MRIAHGVYLLALGAVVSCSADRPLEPIPTPPRVSASLDLSSTGSAPLYQSAAFAINDSSVVVGFAQAGVEDRPRAAVWSPPAYLVTVLPDIGGSSRALSIGNDGTIGGEVCDADVADNAHCHPAYWRNGVLHQLGGFGAVSDVCPCDGHTLVGRTLVNGHDHAAIWEDDFLIDLGVPGDHTNSELTAISHGNIVGEAFNGTPEGDSPTKAQLASYRWSPTTGWVLISDDGVTEVLDVNAHGTAVGAVSVMWPNGSSTAEIIPDGRLAKAINDTDVVAGECVVGQGGGEADIVPCEWTAAGGWVQVGSEFLPTVEGINNSSVMVGEEIHQGRSVALLWTP